MVREKMVEYPPESGQLRKAVELTQSQCLELAVYWKKKAREATDLQLFFNGLAENPPPHN